jgi:hypothetical protein
VGSRVAKKYVERFRANWHVSMMITEQEKLR